MLFSDNTIMFFHLQKKIIGGTTLDAFLSIVIIVVENSHYNTESMKTQRGKQT